MADFGVFAKFARTQRCGHLWRRRLRQMFSDDCTLSAYLLGDRRICAEVYLEPPISASFLGDFPLVPPLKNLRKWPILVSFLNLPELSVAGTFGGTVCVKMFFDDCTLSAY